MLRLYRYDPLDRLTDVAGHQRFYNQARLATEIQGAVPRSVFQVGDQLLAEGGAGGSNLLATDLQRSVLHTVNPDKTQPIAYNVYGHRPAESGVASVLGFNGERADPVTGHYLLGNGYRAFNPVLMRFNSPDSWSPFGRGGINSYGYVGGDPVNRVDPSGHFWRSLKSWLFKSPVKHSALKRTFAPVQTEILKDFKVFSKDVYMARQKDAEGQFSTLLMIGHGSVYKFDSGQKMTYMVSGDELLFPHKLAALLTSGDHLQGVKKIHLAMCLSANYAEDSFAQVLSNTTKLPTTGYVGIMYRREPKPILDSIRNYSQSNEVKVLRIVLDKADLIRERFPSYTYNPRSFLPSSH